MDIKLKMEACPMCGKKDCVFNTPDVIDYWLNQKNENT